VSRLPHVTGSILAAAVVAVACGDVTAVEYGPAPVVVHLTTPFPDDGAVLLALYGPLPPTLDVVAASPGLVVHSVRTADTLRIAVFGSIVSGGLVRLDALDMNMMSQLGTRVEDAASRESTQRGTVSGYALRLQRH
jgi:hypothetical protein